MAFYSIVWEQADTLNKRDYLNCQKLRREKKSGHYYCNSEAVYILRLSSTTNPSRSCDVFRLPAMIYKCLMFWADLLLFQT